MKIRQAVDADALAIFELLELMHAELGEAPINRRKVLEYIQYHIRKNKVFLAIDEAGTMIGTTGVEPITYWYSDAQYLVDTFFYVHPDHRKSAAGTLLLEAARHTAKRLKLILKIAVVNPDRARQRVIPIHGFTPNGYILKT